MIWRAAIVSLLLVLVSAAGVVAQTSTRPTTTPPTTSSAISNGSLTLMSRPNAAWFRMKGDVLVVGRTPMTLNRGMSGRYELTAGEIGYEKWKGTVILAGMSPDTVWITLSEKSAAKAGFRSLLIPGWGQFYDEHSTRGWVFLLSALATGAAIGYNEIRYRDHLDDIDEATAAYAAAQTQAERDAALAAREEAREDADNNLDLRKIFLGIGVGIVGLSVIDAAASVPHPVGTVRLGLGPGNSSSAQARREGPRFALTLANVGF